MLIYKSRPTFGHIKRASQFFDEGQSDHARENGGENNCKQYFVVHGFSFLEMLKNWKSETADHRPAAGKLLARFSQSRLQAALARRSGYLEPLRDFSLYPANGSVMSRVRIRTAIEPA
jgi:hypothetical protein